MTSLPTSGQANLVSKLMTHRDTLSSPKGKLTNPSNFLPLCHYTGRHGFVKFKTRRHAEAARREMNGLRLGAYPIRVVWHHPPTGTIYSGNPMDHRFGANRPISVYVQFETEPNQVMTDTVLHGLFAPLGEVLGVVLPQGPGHFIDGEGGARRGYGFIHFSGK